MTEEEKVNTYIKCVKSLSKCKDANDVAKILSVIYEMDIPTEEKEKYVGTLIRMAHIKEIYDSDSGDYSFAGLIDQDSPTAVAHWILSTMLQFGVKQTDDMADWVDKNGLELYDYFRGPIYDYVSHIINDPEFRRMIAKNIVLYEQLAPFAKWIKK